MAHLLSQAVQPVVAYTFANGTDNTARLFRIDATTGDVFLRQPLDYEMARRYSLALNAQYAQLVRVSFRFVRKCKTVAASRGATSHKCC